MRLTYEQQTIVEENMGLVGKVIKDKVHGPGQDTAFCYDDLFQIGCIGLCKAAATDKGGCFSTYAYRLIWNEICDALIKASRIQENEFFLEDTPRDKNEKALSERDLLLICEQKLLIQTVKERASGMTSKGIECLQLASQGYKSADIASLMDAEPGTVRMWMTKARRFLRQQPEIIACLEERLT